MFNYQLKAKTEMLLSAEAAKTAQRADLESHLETAQHALQDKQQVNKQYSTFFPVQTPISIYNLSQFSIIDCCITLPMSLFKNTGSVNAVCLFAHVCRR